MIKIRVYTLARELKLPSNRVIELARSHGADVSTAANALDQTIADLIRGHRLGTRGRQASGPSASHSRPPSKAESLPAATAVTSPSVETPAETKPPVAPPPPSSRRQHQGTSAPVPVPAPTPGRSAKRYYLVDGLNVCNWQRTPSLAPLLTLLIELKRHGHSFLCIFDANTRFVLEELGERERYEHLIEGFDCVGEVPGGTQADDFILFRAHKTGDAIISNDQYRDLKYRERYKWLRSVSPRLCKGIVLGGFLIVPELDVHARVGESLPSIVKEFEAVFGTPSGKQRTSDHRSEPRRAHRSEPRTVQRAGAKPQPKVETKIEPKPEESARAQSNRPTDHNALQPTEDQNGQLTEQRSPRPRRRRRRGRRGGGGGGGGGASEGAPPQG